MSKKFVKHEGSRVTLIHHQPFDSKNGLKKTENELLEMGALVETIGEKPEPKEGYKRKPFYDEEKNEVYYDYVKKEE